MTSQIYEFTVYVQFQADSQDEARHLLGEYLAAPDLAVYAIGVGDMTAREVAEDDH